MDINSKLKEIKTNAQERKITFHEATKMVEELLKEDENNLDLIFYYAKCKSETGFYEESKRIYERLLDTKLRYDALIEIGIIVRYKIKNVRASEKYFLEVANSNTKKSITAKYELGTLAQNVNDFDKAEKWFMDILENYGPKTRVYIALGKLEYLKGNKEKAIEYINTALNRKPDEYKVKYDCAMAYYFIKEYDLAKPLFKEIDNKYNNNINVKIALENIDKMNTQITDDMLEDKKSDVIYKLGKNKVKTKSYDEARKCFTKIIDNNMQHKIPALIEIAKLEIKANNKDKAKYYLKELLMLDNNNSNALFELAKLELDTKNYEEAIRLFKTIINSNYENKEFALFSLGKIEMSRGNNAESEKYFKVLIENKKSCNYEFALFEYGKLKYKMKEYEEARLIFEQVVNNNYSNKDYALLEIGKIDLIEKKYDEARKQFKELISRNANDSYALFALAKLELECKNINEAKYYFLSVLNKDENNLYAKFELARILEQEGNIEEAIKYFEELLTEDNSKFHAKEFLGKIYYCQKDYEKSYYYLKDCLTESPDDAVSLLDLALSEKKLGMYSDSKEHFLKLACVKGLKSKAYLELARLEIKKDCYEKAKEYYLRSFRSDERHSYIALFELGKLEAKNNNYTDAKMYFSMYKEKYPNDLYCAFELARMESKRRNYKKSKEMLNTILKEKPNDLYTLLELGKVELKQGNTEKARYYINMILEKNNKEIHALLELSKIYMSEENYFEARKILTNLIKENPKDQYAINYLLILDIIEGKYEQVKQITEQNYYAASTYSDLGFYARYKAGLLDNIEYEKTSYFAKQLMSYSRDSAISGIVMDMVDIDSNEGAGLIKGIDIPDLLTKLDTLIKEKEPITKTYTDRYIVTFNYDIGLIEGVKTNQVVVQTLHGTKNIINVYPTISEYEHILVNQKTNSRKRKKQ